MSVPECNLHTIQSQYCFLWSYNHSQYVFIHCSYYIWWRSRSLLPDVIDGEADGRNEEILHTVKAVANWFGVNGVMGHTLTGLADHLKSHIFNRNISFAISLGLSCIPCFEELNVFCL